MCFSWESVHGFPANSRLGYGNCATCHHSPTGGGVLTPYGKSTASEISSFVFFEDEDSKPSPLILGLDSRFLYTHSKGREAFFPMQMDAELGLQIKKLKVIGQLGLYGENYAVASYRAYALIANRVHSVRLGHFAAAFGLNEPDHYLPGRNLLGFDNREASTNLEYVYTSKKFSVSLTGILGCQGALYVENRSEICPKPGEAGGTAQVTVFPDPIATLSLSAAYLHPWEGEEVGKPKGALSWVIGKPKYYTLGEFATEFDTKRLEFLNQGYLRIMAVPLPGFHVGYTYKRSENSYSYGSLFYWYPVSGLEFSGTLERTIGVGSDSTKFLGITHLYF